MDLIFLNLYPQQSIRALMQSKLALMVHQHQSVSCSLSHLCFPCYSCLLLILPSKCILSVYILNLVLGIQDSVAGLSFSSNLDEQLCVCGISSELVQGDAVSNNPFFDPLGHQIIGFGPPQQVRTI